MKSLQAPKRLYKYQAFNVNSLRLLSEAEVYFANPEQFNDPLDCNPTIIVDVDRHALEQLFIRMVSESIGRERARVAIREYRHSSTQYGDYKTDPTVEDNYKRMLASRIQNILGTELGRKGVLSLAERWNCPLMWSHYADQHRGLCLEYDLSDGALETIRPVRYDSPRSIKISDLIEWKMKGLSSAYEAVESTYFYSKAPQWRYEKEWRLTNEGAGSSPAPVRLTGVYFGLKCDVAVETTIVKLYANSQRPVAFYRMYPRETTFGLKKHVIDTAKVEATGLRSSAILDFRNIFLEEPDA